MYAVVDTGGKQYKVTEGDVLDVERLPVEAGETVTFDRVLFVSDGSQVHVGSPYVTGATVTGRLLRETKGHKIVGFKYKPKKHYRRTFGHRQVLSRVKIESIAVADGGESNGS